MDRLDPDTDYAYDPENEDAPEVEQHICFQCDGVIPDDQPRWEQDGKTFCEDCFLPDPDPFDDVAFDGERE